MAYAVGLMSGTSLDGVDVALLRTDGKDLVEPGPAAITPYEEEERAVIRAATEEALAGNLDAAVIVEAGAVVTDAHIRAVRTLLEANSLRKEEISVIGFHGQTILHRPARGRPGEGVTVQIGDGARMASELGIDVVDDFRSADVAAGGEGAPLAPAYHGALARKLARPDPVVAVNLGGVANVTYVAPGMEDADLLAFDTGPGNGMIDLWMQRTTGAAMDENGASAARGQADETVLQTLLRHPFFAAPPPKSLDRYDFSLDPLGDLSAEDGAATLTAFTAEALKSAAAHFPEPPGEWIACGGGRRNPALMAALRARLDAPVRLAEEVGWRGDDVEAECFAYLAMRTLAGAPISFPGTTGAPAPMTGGVLHKARGYSSPSISRRSR